MGSELFGNHAGRPFGWQSRCTLPSQHEYLQGFRFQVAKADQRDPDERFGPVATTGKDKK